MGSERLSEAKGGIHVGKKTAKQIAQEVAAITNYKWQFLRRNDVYIRDCERWSGRKRTERDTRQELVIGYPFQSRLDQLHTIGGKQFSRELAEYHRRHSLEWGRLTFTKALDSWVRERARETGAQARPPRTRKQYTWASYEQKWGISLPLNPSCMFVPFFIQITSHEPVTEPHLSACPGKTVHVNDIYLEQSTVSSIMVDWATPKEHLRQRFEAILDSKKWCLQQHWQVADKRPRFSLFKEYVRVWDAAQEEKSLQHIAQALYPGAFATDASSAKQRVWEYRQAAKQLIQGGYRTIGTPLVTRKK